MTNLFSPLRLIFIGVLVAATVAGFIIVPADAVLPIHWNAAGTADGFAPRDMALLWPLGVTAFVYAIFALVGRFASAKTLAGGRHLSGAVLTGLTALFAAIAIVTVLLGTGVEISMVRVICFAVAALLLLMGNALPKSQPNSVAGIRIPTTLADPANWQATHRLTGWLCMAGAVVLLIAAAFAPATLLIWALIASVAVPMLAGSLYSISLAKRQH